VVAEPVMLAPVPRPIEGSARELLDRVAPSMWELMDTSAKPGDKAGVVDWLGFAFFSVLTAGTLPIVFFSIARARRRRLRRFVRNGLPAAAEVVSIQTEPTAFGEKIARVSYEFEADGVLHRDSDQMLPVIAARWRPGDQVQILYLPDEDYDSVVISTGWTPAR
jgi:hypothetical protein